MDPRSPGDDRRPPPEYPGALLWFGGILLLCTVGLYSFHLSEFAASVVRRPSSLPAELGHAVLPLAVVVGVFYGVHQMFRAAGLGRPLAAASLVAAAAGAAHVQLLLLLERADFGLGAIALMFTNQGLSTVLGGVAVLAGLHRTRGSLPGILWACVALVAVVLLRVWIDEGTVEAREDRMYAAERAEFDRVVEALTEHPAALLVMESPGWTAVDVTDRGAIVYTRADGLQITLDSWGPTDLDPYWSEPDYPGPMRSGCTDEDTVCEDFESEGVSGVVFRSTGPYGDFDVRALVEPEPGSQSHADLYVHSGSPEDVSAEEVIALVHDLRWLEEGGAEKVAEEITGGPRP